MANTTEMAGYMRAIREKLGLSQNEMSQKLGLYQGYVSAVEVGSKLLDPVMAAKWSKRIRSISQTEIVNIALRDMFRANKIALIPSLKDGKLEPVKKAKAEKVAKKVAKKVVAKETKKTKAAGKSKAKRKYTRKAKAQNDNVRQLEVSTPEIAAA